MWVEYWFLYPPLRARAFVRRNKRWGVGEIRRKTRSLQDAVMAFLFLVSLLLNYRIELFSDCCLAQDFVVFEVK